jgi:hypothetical protein
MCAAWDEARDCLSRKDDAGFDAAMRIFWAISGKPRPTNSNQGTGEQLTTLSGN